MTDSTAYEGAGDGLSGKKKSSESVSVSSNISARSSSLRLSSGCASLRATLLSVRPRNPERSVSRYGDNRIDNGRGFVVLGKTGSSHFQYHVAAMAQLVTAGKTNNCKATVDKFVQNGKIRPKLA